MIYVCRIMQDLYHQQKYCFIPWAQLFARTKYPKAHEDFAKTMVPLECCCKRDIHIGVGTDVDKDIDSEMSVSRTWGSF